MSWKPGLVANVYSALPLGQIFHIMKTRTRCLCIVSLAFQKDFSYNGNTINYSLYNETLFPTSFSDAGWDYMPLRCWIGLWTAFFLLLVVAFDLSALVRYITRFTEESFACLIALIFIYEAFKKQFHIVDEYGINPNPDIPISRVCDCFPPGYKPPVVTEFMNDTNVTTTAAMTTGMVVKIGAGMFLRQFL